MNAPAQTRITLDVAQIHAQFGARIMRTLRSRRISEDDAADIYHNLLLLVQTTAKSSFDPAKSSLPTFICGVLLRNAMSSFFAERRQIQDHELQARDAADDEETDSVSLALADAGEESDAESRVALEWFERAVGRELADADLTVFSALGVAGVLENSAEDRAPLCADLHMQDQSVVKIINRIKHTVATLWPDHFDVEMPTARPLRTAIPDAAVPVQAVVATPAVTAVAAVSAPALDVRMPMQQLDLFATAPAVSAPAVAESPAPAAAELGCPMPPVALDPIVVRLPVPVLELVKAQGKAAGASPSWPGFAGSREQRQGLRQAA